MAKSLLKARQAWGMTPRELAMRSGIPAHQIAGIESTGRGEAAAIEAIAQALGGSFEELIAGRPFWESPAHALRSSGSIEPAVVRDGLLRTGGAARLLFELASLLGLPDLWTNTGRPLGPRAVQGDPAKQGEELAEQVRETLGNESEPFASVRDAMWRLGVPSFLVELGNADIDGAMLKHAGSPPAVAVNVLARNGLVTALRMTLAHELCHALFDRPRHGPGGLVEMRTEHATRIEKRANAFAIYFLAPRSAVKRFLGEAGLAPGDRPTVQHVLALSRHFGVGVEAIAWHMVNLQLWDHQAVQQNRGFFSPGFASADDAELRATPSEATVALERRGRVLDLATQALEAHAITVARWRELLGLPIDSDWRTLLSHRHVELPPEA